MVSAVVRKEAVAAKLNGCRCGEDFLRATLFAFPPGVISAILWTTIFMTRTDSGSRRFNVSEWLGYSTIRWCLSGYDARLFLSAVPTAAFSQHADVCGEKTSAARLAAFPVSVDADFAVDEFQ